MRELFRTNNVVLLSYIEALLTEKNIFYQVADEHMSVMDGSLAILPRRIMVDEDDFRAAWEILKAAQAEQPKDDAD